MTSANVVQAKEITNLQSLYITDRELKILAGRVYHIEARKYRRMSLRPYPGFDRHVIAYDGDLIRLSL